MSVDHLPCNMEPCGKSSCFRFARETWNFLAHESSIFCILDRRLTNDCSWSQNLFEADISFSTSRTQGVKGVNLATGWLYIICCKVVTLCHNGSVSVLTPDCNYCWDSHFVVFPRLVLIIITKCKILKIVFAAGNIILFPFLMQWWQ